jgi:hypothetical protein
MLIFFHVGNFSIVAKGDVSQNKLYDGRENPLKYSRTYILGFWCDFELRRIPFDYQTCNIEVI